ncbi:MAG: phosphoenolpyruvate--protein phosphotransferase [Planctomycetes bacterium]|nr:phosphoenolpyruvate--protein phosphotransferase [Planctomycetota bacterium]
MASETSPESEGAGRSDESAPDQALAPAEGAAPAPASGPILRGATVAPGLVLGRVHRQDHDLVKERVERVPLDEIEVELNRFRQALDDSRLQLLDLKARLTGRVREEDARILDTHLAYLRDSAFIADVENLILNEQMRLEGAIGKVVGDFDRIFRLVQNEALRQSAVDLRDVGIRVLRNLEQRATERPAAPPPRDYILVGRELSIVDMFNLANENVKGIVTQSGGLTSHAAIFARSMRIPTLTGVERLLDEVREGDFVILDATEGLVRVNPDELVRAQYAEATQAGAPAASTESAEVPDWARRPARTQDDEKIELEASAGNLPEVEQASALGLTAVGLYRTELLYLTDGTPPSREALVQHYAAVVGAAHGGRVTFRLLSVDSSLGIRYLHPHKERNPSLGRVGIRMLFAQPALLRRQLQAILIAGSGADVRIAVPFVMDCADLRRVREILFEERLELRRTGERFQPAVPVGVVLETPASLLGVRDFSAEADFMLVNLDGLQQHLLAVDREDPELARALETLHPYVLRALAKACEVAAGAGRELAVFGASAQRPENAAHLIGCGFRRFALPPSALQEFLGALAGIDAKAATRVARTSARSTSLSETRFRSLAEFRHGYARP